MKKQTKQNSKPILMGANLKTQLLSELPKYFFSLLFTIGVLGLLFSMSGLPAFGLSDFLQILLYLIILVFLTWSGKTALVTLGVSSLILLFSYFTQTFDALVFGTSQNHKDLMALYEGFYNAKIFPDLALPNDINSNLTVAVSLSYLRRLYILGVTPFVFLLAGKLRLLGLQIGSFIILTVVSFLSPLPSSQSFLLLIALAILCSSLWSPEAFKLHTKQNFANTIKSFSSYFMSAIFPLFLAGLIAFFSLNLFSYNKIFSPELLGIYDDLSNTLPSSFVKKLELLNYTLKDFGYYPLSNRLGGPVDLKTTPIFESSGISSGLLSGSKYNTYDGRRWLNTIDRPYNRFNSPFTLDQQELVFGSPLEKLENAITPVTYGIKPYSPNLQSIFLLGIPQKITFPEGFYQLLFYNESANLNAQNALESQESYQISVKELPNINASAQSLSKNPELKGLLESLNLEAIEKNNQNLNKNEEDKALTIAKRYYLDVPQLPDYQAGGLVYDTARAVTQNTNSELDSIIKLQNYLTSSEFSYDLKMPAPNANQDFVRQFLETKRGYCVYYASAMTMMARSIGIPARYVEGFALSEKITQRNKLPNGNTLVRANQAHAWTEVYIQGLGWITVDPTPGGIDSTLNNKKPEQNETTPSPSPTPTPSPSPQPSGQINSPSPSPSPTPTNTPIPPKPQENKSDYTGLIKTLLVILILVSCLGLAYFLYRKLEEKRKAALEASHDFESLKSKLNDYNLQSLFYWIAIRNLAQGLKSLSDNTNNIDKAILYTPSPLGFRKEYLQILKPYLNNIHSQASFEHGLKSIERIFFSRTDLDESASLNLAKLYDDLESSIKESVPEKVYWKLRKKTFNYDKTLKFAEDLIAKRLEPPVN